MPLPVRPLPVLQNWDCPGCTACCRQYHVSVTPEERARIEGQGWDEDPDLAGVPLFVRTGGWFSTGYRLNHRPDGACVFVGRGGQGKAALRTPLRSAPVRGPVGGADWHGRAHHPTAPAAEVAGGHVER